MIDEEYVKSLRAHWKPRKTVHAGTNSFECGGCGTYIQILGQKPEFCPRCGRPMSAKAVKILIERFCIDKSHEEKTPCSRCAYDPPSSGDGKPCTMCPAIPKNC